MPEDGGSPAVPEEAPATPAEADPAPPDLGDATGDATASPKPKPTARRARARARRILRALHRDAGYLAVGLTVVYAVSGLAVNHILDWNDGDPSFKSYQTIHPLETNPLPEDDAAAVAAVLGQLAIDETPRETYRISPELLEITFTYRTLHVDADLGEIIEEGQEPRPFLHVVNWLHLNRGKRAWTYIADAYAVGLLFLAISGMFMLGGRQGLIGRGGILILLGALVPILYVTLAPTEAPKPKTEEASETLPAPGD